MSFSAQRDEELIDSIVGRQQASAALEAANAAAMLEFVELRRAEGRLKLGGAVAGDLEAGHAAFELSLALCLPVGTIETQLARARRVRSLLPDLWRAWTAGELSSIKVARIDDASRRLTTSASVALLDQKVVAVAIGKTLGQLQSWLTRFVARVEAGRARQRAREARVTRRVWVSPDYDSMSWLNAKLESLDAAQIDARLDTLARAAGSADDRTMDQRRADVFRDLLLGRVDNGFGGDPSSAAPTVIGIVVPIQTLVGESELPGETLDRSMSVPADIVRERAVQPGTLFWRLLTDERGNLLDATQLGRFPSDKLGFAVKVRDGVSAFPTSSVPAGRCDLDHSIAHCGHRRCDDPAHGPTTASNLGPLDRRVHNVKTAGALSLRQPQPGVFEWTTRTGHTYTKQSEPLPVAEWPLAEWPLSEWPVNDEPQRRFPEHPTSIGAAPIEQDLWDRTWDPAWEAACYA